MACAIVTNWGNIIRWTTPNQKDISHVEVYRREDAVTASITTADIVAKIPNVVNTEQAFPFYYDLFTAINTITPYWYWIKSVAYDGQRSTGTAPNPHDTITADRSSIIGLPDGAVTNEPTGFPNRTDSTISFNDGTRTLSISPTTTSFDYYIKGQKFTVTAAQTVVPTETTGLTWFYFVSATLTAGSNLTHSQQEALIEENALVAALYWNTAQATHIYFGEERHGLTMDGMTHRYLHETVGLAYQSGLGLVNFTADQTGADDVDAQFGHTLGEVYDEDIGHAIDAVASTVGLPIWYRSGNNGSWLSKVNAGFSVATAAAGTRLTWNEWTGATWQLSEVSNNQFVLCHVFATTENDTPMIAIMGQADYGNLAAAQTGSTTEINELLLGNLPGSEIRPIGTVIFQTAGGYGNQVNARVRSVAGGGSYIDWRSAIVAGAGVTASDHGILSGLSDDDHTQYVINDGSRGAQSISADVSFGNAVTISGITSINNDLNVSGDFTVAGTATVSYLTVTAAASIQTTLHVSGAVTFGSTLTVSSEGTFNDGVTIYSAALVKNFIEFTAATSHPATPDNGIRVYSQVTGSVTKLMYKDSAGTTYQIATV